MILMTLHFSVRKNGSKVGEVESNGSIRLNGSKIGEIESNGSLRKGGKHIEAKTQ